MSQIEELSAIAQKKAESVGRLEAAKIFLQWAVSHKDEISFAAKDDLFKLVDELRASSS